jgi:hypothetical protein
MLKSFYLLLQRIFQHYITEQKGISQADSCLPNLQPHYTLEHLTMYTLLPNHPDKSLTLALFHLSEYKALFIACS